jgi:hypothetical protein
VAVGFLPENLTLPPDFIFLLVAMSLTSLWGDGVNVLEVIAAFTLGGQLKYGQSPMQAGRWNLPDCDGFTVLNVDQNEELRFHHGTN